MHDYNTIIGVIRMKKENISHPIVRQRYGIGNSGIDLILSRYKDTGLSWEDFIKLEPAQAERLIYPPKNIRKDDVPMPDFEHYYDRMMSEGSKVNMFYCWLDYKSKHPDGYQTSQFYEYFKRFIEENHGGKQVSMAVERIPGEKLYIDWVGDQPEILVDAETGELKKVHVFITTIGVSSLVYAECFLDEKLPSFMQGTVNAITFYDAVPRYLIPDNCRTAVTKHTKDELVLNTAYQDLEEFYDVVILPPPARKPKGKPTVENHVRYIETHLIEKLKENVFTSIESINDETHKIIADINRREFQKKVGSRMDAYLKYDKPHMKPLPGDKYSTCDYKYILKVPDNYHLEYDGHYYSVLYTYRGQPAIIKATPTEIIICDRNNRFICKHRRSYRDFPKYITDDSHMKPEHLYYKEVNARDGAYYRRWAAAYGEYTAEMIDQVLRSARHEEQAYNSCAGILHSCKAIPHGIVEEAARKCIEMHACKYSYFKRVLGAVANSADSGGGKSLPAHSNIRGKDFYK